MIDHFVRAHLHMYNQALSEIKNGKKSITLDLVHISTIIRIR